MERVICSKANYLVDVLGHDVTILTTDQDRNPNFYSFSDKIRFIDLAINYSELNKYPFPKRIWEQRKKMKNHLTRLTETLEKLKADIVISTYTYEFTLLPLIKDGSKKIGEIHFSKTFLDIEIRHKKQPFLLKTAYMLANKRKFRFIRKYDKFVVLTKEDQENWKGYDNIAQIYNPLPFYPDTVSPLNTQRVVSVGRLNWQKGFDLLIAAWKIVNKDFPDWQLDIFGKGEEREKLIALINQFQLEKIVKIHQPTQEIVKEYSASSIYAMTSRYEGFGMVLVEAMACGLPCVSFDCPYGPSEIIRDGKTGFLVEDGNIGQLAEKIKMLITDENRRKKMGHNARKDIYRFSIEVIMTQWETLFEQVIRNTK
ncbi:glycosyl transferase [Bacteroidia bacterium]|nr:glycosyl transferase [Bacteroidia bacterium]